MPGKAGAKPAFLFSQEQSLTIAAIVRVGNNEYSCWFHGCFAYLALFVPAVPACPGWRYAIFRDNFSLLKQ
jgi:hypothetical protein